jgi:hypothetical protein
MSEEFSPDEKLFRAVMNSELFWKADRTLTTAIFKNRTKTEGISVDRQNGRGDSESVALYRGHLSGSVIYVNVQNCYDCETLPVYKPIETEPQNPYHSEIHRNCDTVQLTQGQSRQLTLAAVIIYYEYRICS